MIPCHLGLHLGLHQAPMAQTVSHQVLTTEAWVQSQYIPCGICGRQSGTGTAFS
jgi:hypothetical protein